MVETRRNRERDAKQREKGEKSLHTEKGFVRSVFGFRRQEAQNEQMCAGQREKRRRQSPAIIGPEHLAQGEQKTNHVCDGNEIFHFVNAPLPPAVDYRQNRKQNEGERRKNERTSHFFRRVKVVVPSPKINLSREERGRREPFPLARVFESEHAGGEHRGICEEDDFVVDAGADQFGRQESTDQRKEGQALRAASQRYGDHHGRDDEHSGEGLARIENVEVMRAAP